MDNKTEFVRYYRIDFTGKPRAFDKYLKLQDICTEALSWCRDRGVRAEAQTIAHWMNHSGGFVRPHTPYYVTLTEHEYEALILGVRRDGTGQKDYMWIRFYGGWV